MHTSYHTFNLLEWEVSYLREFSVIKLKKHEKNIFFGYNEQLWQGLLLAEGPHSLRILSTCHSRTVVYTDRGLQKAAPGKKIDHEVRKLPSNPKSIFYWPLFKAASSSIFRFLIISKAWALTGMMAEALRCR